MSDCCEACFHIGSATAANRFHDQKRAAQKRYETALAEFKRRDVSRFLEPQTYPEYVPGGWFRSSKFIHHRTGVWAVPLGNAFWDDNAEGTYSVDVGMTADGRLVPMTSPSTVLEYNGNLGKPEILADWLEAALKKMG